MPYTINNLIMDVLPRVGRMEGGAGITIWQAANSILSLVFKKLLDRNSDLLASGDLNLSIPALGYYANLPSDFLSMAEKPKVVDILTDWMAGTVISYNATTGVLVVNVTVANGISQLSAWNISLGALPGTPASTVGTSTTQLTVGTGSKSVTTQTGLTLSTGQYVIISSSILPTDWEARSGRLQPYPLDDDDHSEYTWWDWYGVYGESWEPPCIRPGKFKIIGTTFYVRPKVIANIMITGKYNQKPSSFSLVSDVIPWNGFFDEIFREGVVRIITQGISIPDANQDFSLFFQREFDTIINSRIHLVPSIGRLKRSNWL